MKYLKRWESQKHDIVVKIVTPKVAENRQSIFWYADGNHLAIVSDQYHEFTIHIDKFGSRPTKEELDSELTDADFNTNLDDYFRIEFYVPSGDIVPCDGSENLVIDTANYYDEAIKKAKKALSDPSILEDIANTNSCDCVLCKKVRTQKRFGL